MEKIENVCPVCKEKKERTQFYSFPCKPQQKIFICRDCINSIMAKATEATNDSYRGLWVALMMCGIPYKQEIVDKMKAQIATNVLAQNINIFNLYLVSLSGSGIPPQGLWESDEYPQGKVEQTDAEDDDSVDESTEEENEADIQRQERLNEWRATWGERGSKDSDGQYTEEDYQMLDSYFERYTENDYSMDAAKRFRYRDLCRAELRKFKGDDSKEVTEEILKLLKLLKLDQFADNRRSEIQQFIERQAWEIENISPAECEDLEKYKDYSGFLPHWNEIMRCVRNLIAGTRDYPDVPPEER